MTARHSDAYWRRMAAWLNAPTYSPAEQLCRAIKAAQATKREAAK